MVNRREFLVGATAVAEPADFPEGQGDLAFLLHQALARIPLLPFALAMDRWRWGVFAGKLAPADYNHAW